MAMNLRALTGSRAFKVLKATAIGWMDDNALRLSAALAYYSIFSIAPLLIIAISVAGLALGEEAARGQLYDQLKSYVGAQAAESVQSMVQSASKKSDGWMGAAIGFGTLLVGASGVFAQLKDALNTIWNVRAKGGAGIWRFVRERLLNFGLVLVIGFLLLTSLVLTAALAGLNGYFENLIGMPAFVGVVFASAVSFGLVTTLFAFIFKVLPDAQIEWRNVWFGAAVTALLFELGKFGLSYYLGRESTASSFGAAGAVILLLLWVYYASCILLFGAEFTRVYAQETGHAIRPSPGAELVSAEVRAQQGLPQTETPPVKIAAPRTEAITIAAPPAGFHSAGLLLAVAAGSFVIGLLARRRAEMAAPPATRIREGLEDLSGQATKSLVDLLHSARDEIARRVG